MSGRVFARVTDRRPAVAGVVCVLVGAMLTGGMAMRVGGGGAGLTVDGGVVDLNAASAAELMLLPGIGEKRAAEIVAYRERVGGFRAVSQLARIDGIGSRTVRRLRGVVVVGEWAAE